MIINNMYERNCHAQNWYKLRDHRFLIQAIVVFIIIVEITINNKDRLIAIAIAS